MLHIGKLERKMINLLEYDDVSPKINKKKSWISIKTKQLFSREIKFKPYVTIGSKYHPDIKGCTYYLILLDEIPDDRTYSRVHVDNYGRVKISLKSIWNKTTLEDYSENSNISIELIDYADNAVIYQIDV